MTFLNLNFNQQALIKTAESHSATFGLPAGKLFGPGKKLPLHITFSPIRRTTEKTRQPCHPAAFRKMTACRGEDNSAGKR